MSSLDTVLVWLDSGVCSQNPAHSFRIGGQLLPLCARDLGLFAGFLLAAAMLNRPRIRPSQLYALGLLPLLADGLNSFAGDAFAASLYEPSNMLRLATGLLAGASLALLVRNSYSLSLAGRGPTSACHSARRAKNLPPVSVGPTYSLSLAGRGQGRGLTVLLKSITARPQADRLGLICGAVGALGALSPHLALAAIATAGILSLLATANRLAHPLAGRSAWALALPELAALAGLKQLALLALR